MSIILCRCERLARGLPSVQGRDRGLPSVQGRDRGLPSVQGRDRGLPLLQGRDRGLPSVQGRDRGLPSVQGRDRDGRTKKITIPAKASRSLLMAGFDYAQPAPDEIAIAVARCVKTDRSAATTG